MASLQTRPVLSQNPWGASEKECSTRVASDSPGPGTPEFANRSVREVRGSTTISRGSNKIPRRRRDSAAHLSAPDSLLIRECSGRPPRAKARKQRARRGNTASGATDREHRPRSAVTAGRATSYYLLASSRVGRALSVPFANISHAAAASPAIEANLAPRAAPPGSKSPLRNGDSAKGVSPSRAGT